VLLNYCQIRVGEVDVENKKRILAKPFMAAVSEYCEWYDPSGEGGENSKKKKSK
jgi:hypothetical protein